MNAGRFIGRVGGLAVLLGVGIALGQGVASADATPSAGPSSSSSSSAQHAPRKASAPNRTTVAEDWNSGNSTTRVVVIDPATGGQIGNTLVLNADAVQPPQLTPDGTRASSTEVSVLQIT